jgi:pyruvate formate lyase activating enzyme
MLVMGREEPHEAVLWEPAPDDSDKDAVQCNLCAHRCLIKSGKLGTCQVRRNIGGKLISRVYGMATTLGVDPIEKKPLFHFHPGAGALSIATVGCNFSCQHCQNHSISQWQRGEDAHAPVPGRYVEPQEVVRAALQSGSEVIAYTYTEPTIYMEYALDTARLAHEQGVRNIFVTNGYMTAEAVELIAPYLHGANVDLKGLDDRMLKRECKAESGPVLRTIEDLVQRGIWVEVTTLVIPGSNDDDEQLGGIARFIAGVSQDIPWHVSRFHPTFQRMDRPPTPIKTLHRARQLGEEAGLHYVFTGNVWGDNGESSRCPGCGAVVIERRGYSLGRVAMKDGRCTGCGHCIAGRGMP